MAQIAQSIESPNMLTPADSPGTESGEDSETIRAAGDSRGGGTDDTDRPGSGYHPQPIPWLPL